jgi:arginyl-tRNA synthetase
VFESERRAIEAQILQALESAGAPAPGPIAFAPLPFSGRWGLGSPVCFQAAAAEARAGRVGAIPSRAAELAAAIAPALRLPPGVSRIEADRGYLNVYFETAVFAGRVVAEVEQAGTGYGSGPPRGERVMVEFAQPNTHHSIHIGHARTAILGESLARIVEFSGFDTIRASYPGDIGLGVITCVWAYAKFYAGQEPQGIHERGRWLAAIYAEATARLEPKEGETPEDRAQREGYDRERREMLLQWSEGDPEVRRLWERTRQWSLDELNEILTTLDIRMDVFFYESQVEESSKQMVEELIAQGIAEDERPTGGPVIVRIDEKLGLKKEKYRTAVLLRSDGTSLYLTKDLALARVKFEQYGVDRSIYVVDVRQTLHFQQAFKILELWGFPQAPKCYHLAYGFLTLPEGAMSSRRGNVIFLKDVYDEAVRRVEDVIAEKNPDMPAEQRPAVAAQVGLGALAYALLSVDSSKDIVFDWDSALSFDGQTGPYLQNAAVRAAGILRKAGEVPPLPAFDRELTEHEVSLIDLTARFPDVVRQAADEYKPLLVANYVYELARAFHAFYHSDPVLQAPEPSVRTSRLHLTRAVRQTLENALRLLVIATPEQM